VARAEPFDLVFMVYVAFSGLLVVGFGWRLSTGVWLGLTAAHLALLAAAAWWARQPRRYPSLGGFVRDVYPFLFIFFLYWELRYLALLFSDGYHDSVILQLETMLFGEQLAMTLSQRLPYLWLSEIMHFFYGIYWILLPLGALGGARARRFRARMWRWRWRSCWSAGGTIGSSGWRCCHL
jgi:hypothetical protein